MTVKSYDREALKAARLAGATVAELMVTYDCTESLIRTRLHRMGVKLPAEVTLDRSMRGSAFDTRKPGRIMMRGTPFLHRSLMPLDEVDLDKAVEPPNFDFDGCGGGCGL